MVLGLEDLKKFSKPLKTQDVEVPALGGTVRLSEINASDRLSLLIALKSREGESDADVIGAMWFDVLCYSIIDETGARPFKTKEGREILQSMQTHLLAEVSSAAMDLNGFTEEAIKLALETAEKNLQAAQLGNLPLSCAENSDTPIPTTCSVN